VQASTTIWYLECQDSHTNEVVATILDGLHNQEKFSSLLCDDGKIRELVKVPDYAFISRLEKSKVHLHIDFKISMQKAKASLVSGNLENFKRRR
jgi:hypothetical protein